MEVINEVIMIVAIAICVILCLYLVRWAGWKRIKPAYMRKNLVNFGWIQALVLNLALAVNNFCLDFRDIETGGLYALIPIASALFLCLVSNEVLKKNFVNGVKEGEVCLFWVADIKKNELGGFAILKGNNWLPAKAEIAPGTAKNYEEHQQMTAVVSYGEPDGKFIIVRL